MIRNLAFIFAAVVSITAACNCSSGLSCCNNQCFNPTSYSCPTDSVTGNSVLCSAPSTQSCNGACYNPTAYSCVGGSLAQGASSSSGSSSASSTSSSCQTMFAGLTCRTSSEDPTQISTTSVSNSRNWLCGNFPAYCTQISSGGQYASCNSVEQLSYAMNLYYAANINQGPSACNFGGIAQIITPAATPTTSAAASTTSTVCQTMFAGLSCRTASEDPTQVSASSVTNARNWLCSAYPQYCTAIQSGGQYSSCNSVEQISYAMSQYYNTYQSQGSSACSFNGLGVVQQQQVAPTPTTSAASSSTTCQTMWAGLTCRTTSEDPSTLNPSALSGARSWLCSNYQQFCTQINNGGTYYGCNAAEQLSYAMNLYYQNYQSQGPSACSFGGVAQLVSSATPTTAAPVNVNPTPSPGGFPTQTADLRIINNCKTTLWFEARYGGAGAPLPGQTVTATQALPGSYVDYTVPDTGLSGSRFWAKYGCNSQGQNCQIGDQMQYWPNPPGGCPVGGCTPPIDSLFEATWGCRPGTSCNSANPTTWFDTSQVDGWTLPYKLTPVGDTSGCDCSGSSCGFNGVDASTLDVSQCPTGENLVGGGQTTVDYYGNTINLNSVDLRLINNGTILGCMSPCKRLNWGAPYGLQQPENSGATLWMCCPTPDPSNCLTSNGCVTPDECRAGPIVNTQYVADVHRMAPGVYAYSYDDGVGLHACPAGVTKYTMEFCPSGSAQYPAYV